MQKQLYPTSFADTLSEMANFIRNNGSEFLLVSIKEDASAKNSDINFTDCLEQLLLSYPEVNTSRELPSTVGAARGGIHIISRYSSATIGLPCYIGYTENITFTYDANGNLIKQASECDGEEMYSDIFTYDANGNLIKEVSVYGGVQDYAYEYTFDENGNVIKPVYTDSEGASRTKEMVFKLVFIDKDVTEKIENVLEFNYL